MKKCGRCNELKKVSDFYQTKSGPSSYCIACQREYQKEYYKKNKYYQEKLAEYNRQYKKNNKEYLEKRSREYYKKNRDRILEYKRKYRERNKDKISQYNYKSTILESKRKYRERNKDKISKANLEYREKSKKNISDSYVKRLLNKGDLPITPETIEIKRLQIKIYREIHGKNNH